MKICACNANAREAAFNSNTISPWRAVGRLAKAFVLGVSLIGLAAWGGDAMAAVRTSTATGGLWSATTTWVGGVVPAAADTAIIATTGANAVTLGANPTSPTILTINAGGTLNLAAFRIRPTGATNISGTINLGTNTGNRFTGLVTLNAGGVWTNTTTAVNFRGGLTNNGGTFTAGTGIQSFTNVAQAIGGTSPISIPSLTVTTIALTNNGNLTVPTALAGSGSLVNSATGTLNLGGTSAITTLTANAVGNTVNYTGAAQTVKATIYHHLGLGGSGAKTIAATTINGNFTMSGTATAAPTGALTVGGDFIIGATNTFTAGAFLHSVKGNWSNSGTFTAGTSTVTLNGTAMQTVTGTNTFSKLTLTNAAGVTISGNTTVTGTFTPGTTPITVNAGSTLTIGATTYTGPCSGVYGAGYCASPTVKSINTANPNPTAGATPVSWTVVFGTSVTGVTASNFALVQGGGVSGAAITSVTGGANTWTVTANVGTGSGTLGLNMVNVTGISPAVITAMPFPGQVYTIDRNPPTVSSIALANPDPTGLASVSWNVTFSKSVTGVDATDFALVQAGGVSGALITSVTGGGASWTVTASTGIGNGTLGLNLIDNDTIIDSASIPLGGPGLGNGNFTSAVYTVSRPVFYYHDTTTGVNIGFDGATNVTGADQIIPPIITALLNPVSTCTVTSARSINHPVGLYTHSRWYLNTNYAVDTNIGANPTGSASLRGAAATGNTVVVSLYDYDPVSGAKTLIGSSPAIPIGTATATYTYTIASALYTVPAGHRLMLQYDFNQPVATDRARVYCSATASYIAVTETPAQTLTCFTDNFNRANGSPAGNWVVANEGGLFGNPAIVGNRLRLTDATNSVSTMAALQQLFPAAGNKIIVEFDHFAYGGNGADGIGVALSDASVAPVPGAFGGSLGYAPKQVALGGDTTHPGFAGGWIGLALDEYGNFSANTEGRSGGAAPGLTIDSAAIRGSGSGYAGYPYHRGTATLVPGVDVAGATPAPGYRYRIIIDHTNGAQAWTSVERDITGTGNSYSYLISPYDAKAEPGQAAVPTNWFLSFTGSTGASTNIHEVDNLRICSTQPQPMPTLDHISILHDGNALTCSPESITLKACADANCSTLYLGAVTVNMTAIAGATWSPDPVTFTGGQKTVTLAKSTAGAVTLGGTATSPAAVNATTCWNTVTSTASCAMTFSNSGFLVTVPDHVSCSNPNPTVTIEAVQQGVPANRCVPAFANLSLPVNLYTSYADPISGTVGATASTGAVSTAAPGTLHNLSFNANGTASITLSYPDAGKLTLTAKGTAPTGAAMIGSGTFVVAPASFVFSGIPAAPLTAGQPFNATVTAMRTACTMPAAPAAATPNFNQTVMITSSNPQPGIGNATAINTPLSGFSNGAASTNLTWNEVGTIDLNASIAAYLGSALSVSGIQAGVGRFHPAYFDTAVTPGCGTFTYAGSTAPVKAGQPFVVTVTANKAAGGITKNYAGATYAYSTTLSNAGVTAGLAGNIIAPAGFANGVGSANVTYEVATPQTAPLTLALRATDGDTPAVSSSGHTEGTAEIRSGRAKLGNAYGSELLGLRLPFRTEFWNNGWLFNSADSCTGDETVLGASNAVSVALTAPPPATCVQDSGSPGLSGAGCAVAGPAAQSFRKGATPGIGFAGDFNLWLRAPGAGATGAVTVTGSVPVWLQFDWNTAVPGLENPSSRATFGVYQGRKEFMYMRENY